MSTFRSVTDRIFVTGTFALCFFFLWTIFAYKTLSLTPWQEEASIRGTTNEAYDEEKILEGGDGLQALHSFALIMKHNDFMTENGNVENVARESSKQKEKRIVILPGPHKTGSTAVQKFLVKWTREGIIKDWTWPVIKTQTKYGPEKAYHGLYFELRGVRWGPGGAYPTLKNAYKDLFHEVWSNGQSIVFGTETFDFLLVRGGGRIVDEIIDMMPWEGGVVTARTNFGPTPINKSLTIEDIVVSVTYRSPRATHLLSLWHEIGFRSQSLAEFIVALSHDADQWHALNPLGLADLFFRKGLSVVIVDTSGVERDGLDISHVVACEVLNVACINGRVIGATERQTVINKKEGRGEMDLNEDQLRRIEVILKALDHSYCHLAKESRVHILHRESVFSSCENVAERDYAFTFSDIIKRLKQVAIEVTGHEYAKLKVDCGDHYSISCLNCPLRIWQQLGGFKSRCEEDCKVCNTGYSGKKCIPSSDECQTVWNKDYVD